MKQILKLVFLLVIGQTAFAQAPSNYTNINGRYRWIAGMFDSTFHIPKGTTPSLRTGGSTNSGGLFYNTSDSSVYTYTGTQWIKLRGSINPSDTTNKYVTQVYKKNASDSVFYVKGGNHLFAFIDSVGSPGGGGGGKVYYFNGGVSMGTFGGFAMYELGDTANTGAAANFTRSTTGNIANFITDPGKPGLLQIPAGVWSVDAWLSETGGGANHAEIWVEVEKWDGSTITTIATSPIEQITEGGTPNLYSWSVSIPTTSLTVTDRIIIQFYISNTNGKTVTLYTQNGYVGEVHTTFTTGIGAINGLTAPAQYLVTGTSGTDFNINSSTATHTFNLPTASATNRGALSTTDWSTFNNKIGGSLVSGYLTKATGTNTIDTSQIYQSNGKIGIGRTNPTAKVEVYDSLGTGVKSTMRSQINTDVALDVKTIGNRGFALIVDQADSSASGTQYQTIFRKSMMPGTGNPAPGAGVSWYTQISNDNNNNPAVSVYRARIIDSTGYASGLIKQTSTEFWTRKNNVWDTTLVLNGGNVGINTGQNGIDSALTVANGTWLKRGVRMSALPTGVGTKALRIDANGNVSTTDTTATTGFVPYTGATTSLDMGLFNIYGQNIVSNNYATGAAMSSISRSDITASAYGVLQLKRGVWGTLQPNPLTAFDKNWYLPDTSGTLALASQLSGYVPTTRTITINGTSQDLSANRTYNVGTITSVATNTGTGITGGTITTSGTIAADTLLLSTRAWRQKGVDSVASLINTRISGTTNYIPKFTSSSAIGNSIMSQGSDYIVVEAANANLRIKSTTREYFWQTVESGGRFRLYDQTAGSERLTIDASGNLGLGTSSPNSKMEILRTSAGSITSQLLLHNGSDNDGTGARLDFSGLVDGSIATGSLANVRDGAGLYSLRFYTFGAGSANNERMRLDASGNLGLGVSPSAWARKAIQIGDAAQGYVVSNTRTGFAVNMYYDGNNKYIENNYAALYAQDGTSGQHQWYIAPSGTAGNTISFTQAMTLDASGRLGIGTTSPGDKLQVDGNVYANAFHAVGSIARFVSGGGTFIAGLNGSSYGSIQSYSDASGTGRALAINPSGGNVGIGTTSPDTRTNIVKNALTKSWSADADDILAIENNGTTLVDIRSSNAAAGYVSFSDGDARARGLITYSHASDDMRFNTAGSERMRITSGGELLINTTSDAGDYKLQVNGSAYLATTSGQALIALKSTGSTVGGQLGIQSTGELFLYMGDNKDMQFSTNGINNMTLKANGNLEIASGSIKTGAPSGGTAKPWKLGQAGVSVGGANTTAVAVEIDGTVYYLLTAYLPEPEPDPAALPSSGPSASYKPYNKPIPVKTTKDVEIENLRKEIEELKQLIKNK